MRVQTVLGAVAAESLGRTLVHEHLFLAYPGSEFDPRLVFDRAAFVRLACRRLEALKHFGVATIVDPCPIEFGRDVGLMAEISERAGIHVVCTTGFYFERLGLPPYWRGRSAEQIAALYIEEAENGIGAARIRPGAIKCATGAGAISALEERFLTAACLAHHATGLPIITHTQGGTCGPEQQALFTRNGVAPHRCLIGHCCENPDPAYHRRIVEGGSYIGFDRIGLTRLQSDEVRADNLVRLVRSGFGSQVMMSQDRYCALIGDPLSEAPSAEVLAQMARGEWPPPYSYLFTDFIPMLRERGLADSEIFPMLDDTPRRFLSGT